MYLNVFSQEQVYVHKYRLFVQVPVFHILRKKHTSIINIFHKGGIF